MFCTDDVGALSSGVPGVLESREGENARQTILVAQPHMSNSTNVQLSKHYQRELGKGRMGVFGGQQKRKWKNAIFKSWNQEQADFDNKDSSRWLSIPTSKVRN